jgi:hypothetical protein
MRNLPQDLPLAPLLLPSRLKPLSALSFLLFPHSSGYVFITAGAAVSLSSKKQGCTVHSTKAKYIMQSKATHEVTPSLASSL